MNQLLKRHKLHITRQLTKMKIDKGISIDKIYEAIKEFVNSTIVAFKAFLA